MNCKMKGIPAAVILALAAASSQAALERVGPVDRSPTVGGFPAWFQDRSGVAVEFCDLKTQAEWDALTARSQSNLDSLREQDRSRSMVGGNR